LSALDRSSDLSTAWQILALMDPAVAAALVAGGWTVLGALGTQWLAGRREAARDKDQAEREERNQRWDTNRERLIELRGLLDQSGVALMAFEEAVNDLHTASLMREHVGIEVSAEKVKRVDSLESEVAELEGRLALRLGTTHPVTRSFTLARIALVDGHLKLRAALAGAAPSEPADSDEGMGRSKLSVALDESRRDARKYRLQFFEGARELIGVQKPLEAVAPGRSPEARAQREEQDEKDEQDEKRDGEG
jgi:hypothetical protein